MNRKPDEIREVIHRGAMVTVSIWTDISQDPWDGDGDPPPGDGWDAAVEAALSLGTDRFIGRDSLGSIWGDDRFVQETIEGDLIPMALASLDAELARVAAGADVTSAEKRQALVTAWLSAAERRNS